MRKVEGCEQTHSFTKLEDAEENTNSEFARTVKYMFMIFIELVAFIDFWTDFWCLYKMILSIHIAWASMTMLSMAAPLYICHIPYVSFLS